MQINWNRFIPLLALLLVGAALLIVGAFTGERELLVVGAALAFGAGGAIVPTGAIGSIPVVPATRRDTDDVDTDPLRKARRQGFALPDVLSAIVLVAILTLAALAGFALSGCGASEAEVRATACGATRLACHACQAAQDRWCGGAPVETEEDEDQKPCPEPSTAGGELPAPAIDREYPTGGGET